MSKLNVDQKTIQELLANKKSDFMIPDYQRPYAWEETECLTLWEDIFAFAFPDDDYSKFDSNNDEYFLGPIVTFKNNEKMEVIDGQQRLTTLMLLLRAFYMRFNHMKDENSKTTRENIEKCIWKTNEFGKPDMDALKINSEVATDDDKEEFLTVLKTGKISKHSKSNYAKNYRFFEEKIDEFLQKYPAYFSYLPTRILNNCIILPIEAESQDTALRIFSTLNNRGKSLSDSDIFKSELYKYFSSIGKKELFIDKWRDLEALCEKIFKPSTGTPMDELFTRYMYYERAKAGMKSSTTEALRKFYEKNNYYLLKNETTLENLIALANFWNDVSNQDRNKFSLEILKQLYVLNYAPNGMWTYFASVYFMRNKNEEGLLEDKPFKEFLSKMTAFIWAYAVTNPGVNALRTPVFAEMVNIIEGKSVRFLDFKFDINVMKNVFENFSFNNNRPITKSMLTWWAYTNNNQKLLSLDTTLETEHIFARNRQAKENSLKNVKNLEVLGNKILLEKRINIRASDYRFSDKIKYYQGYINSKGKEIDGTQIEELIIISNEKNDFNEQDIEKRNNDIINGFIRYISENELSLT